MSIAFVDKRCERIQENQIKCIIAGSFNKITKLPFIIWKFIVMENVIELILHFQVANQ